MSLFARPLYSSDPSFTNLFRLLDDFDSYSRGVQGTQTSTDGTDSGRRQGRVLAPTFSPKFDVRETEASYELHGEFPGIDRENVHIEFPEPQTIVIRGRVERSYTSGTPPASMSGAITEKGEGHASHKATVEDEATEQAKERGTETQVTKHAGGGNVEKQHKAPQEKFWLSERSIGEFSRSFSFPSRIDLDAVSAKLNNGILTIVVPKSKKSEMRQIPILGDD